MGTTVYMQGAIEPLELDEPLNATMLNMSAAHNSNLLFFMGNSVSGHVVMVNIPKVLYMEDSGDE